MKADDDKLVHAIYACATSDDAIPKCLALLADRFSCRSAALVYQDRGRQIADMTASHGFSAAAQERYRTEFARHDPAPAAMAQLEVGTATSTGRLFDNPDERHKYFLEEFYYPLGLREALGGPIARHQDRFGLVAVQRGPERQAFDDADIRSFERLMPHIVQAMTIRRSFFELEQRTEAFRAAIEPLPIAMMILSADRRIQHANLEARSILDRRDGLVVERSSKLSALKQEVLNRLADVAQNGSSVAQVIDVPRASGKRPYLVSVSGPPAGLDGEDRTTVLLRVHDPDRHFPEAERLIRDAFGMSAPAARLTAALVSGQSLATYAARDQIPLNTVKFHLKSAFNATGTNRQTELVRRASAAVRDLAS